MALPPEKKKSRDLGLVVGFIVCLILAIVLLIILLTLTFKEPGCDTRECVTAAAEIMNTMNLDADPCDDFYEYACGNYEEEMPFTEKYVWSARTDIKSKVDNKIFQEMQNMYGDNDSILKAKKFYKACMDTDAINEAGSMPLLQLIKHMGSWQLSRGTSGTLSPSRWTIEKYVARAHVLQRPVFFSVQGGVSDMEAYRFVPHSEIPLHYFEKMPDEAQESTIGFIKNLAKLLNPGTTVNELDTIAKNIFRLNYNVSQLEYSCYKTGSTKTFASMQEFAQHVEGWFDLPKYWKEMTTENMPSSGNVTVICPEFFKELEYLLKPPQTTTETVANTLVWNTIHRFTATMGNEFRNAYKRSIRWLDITLPERSSSQERWEYCLEKALDYFPGPLLTVYASSTYDEAEKKEVEDMVTQIVDAYTKELEDDITWMGDEDKKLQEIKRLQRAIARDSQVLDLEAMDDEYDDYEVGEDNFANHRKLRYKGHERSLEPKSVRDARPDYTRGYQGTHHLKNPSKIGMSSFILDVPSGALQRPYYSADFPSAINYGALGSRIAGEFVPRYSLRSSERGGAAADASGTNMTLDGNATTPSMTIFGRFARSVDGREKRDAGDEERTRQSLVEELQKQHNDLDLSGYKVQRQEMEKVFRELGGLQLSYQAYMKWVAKHPDSAYMVGLKLSAEEVFFLGFAQRRCIHIAPELREKIAIFGIQILDFHQSMNQVLMNTDEFAEAYGCSKKDGTMNPSFEKVEVWK